MLEFELNREKKKWFRKGQLCINCKQSRGLAPFINSDVSTDNLTNIFLANNNLQGI